MPKTKNDRIYLTAEEALGIVKRNPDGGAHTFVNPRFGILIGADHTKDEIEAEIKDAKVRELGGEQCRMLSHQLYLDLGEDQYFVATDDEKVDELERKNHV